MPTIYIPHGGGPCFFMDWTMGPPDTWARMQAFLAGLVDTLPARPRAILVVSGHWEEPRPTVNRQAAPPLYFDYYGFPEHTYRLRFDAPGDPVLAERAASLLAAAGIAAGVDDRRGLDHGVFIPLKVMTPAADIPVVQLSLVAGLDPAAHLALGRALAPLRDEGVLILGSGMSYHNMRRFLQPAALAESTAFDAWLTETVAAPAAERDARLRAWTAAPAARLAHPREEHLVPLHVAAGAAEGDAGRKVFEDVVLGAKVSAFAFGT